MITRTLLSVKTRILTIGLRQLAAPVQALHSQYIGAHLVSLLLRAEELTRSYAS